LEKRMFDEVKGFRVTFMRLFKPNVTINYPEEKRHHAPRFRGLPSLRTDPETGEALCVACGLCARICPTTCLEMHIVPSEEGDRELGEFILRSGRCLFCGLCSQVCPVDAITMSHEYELSVLDRDGLIYTKTELAAIGGQLPNWWEDGTGEFAGAPDAWAGTRDGKALLGKGVDRS
jgi:NADH-quinone oxidoreductase subunit I